MKKLTLSLCAVLVSLPVLATGTVGVDPVQTGSLTFNATTGFYITNTFPFTFTTAPVMQFFAGTTNATPITNILSTTTNFAVSVNATNPASQVNWIASVGYPRFQNGSNAVQASLLLTNVFATPFAFNPVVNISGTSTNVVTGGGAPAISSVTPTQFVIQFGNTNQIIFWEASGICLTPGTYNPNAPAITY